MKTIIPVLAFLLLAACSKPLPPVIWQKHAVSFNLQKPKFTLHGPANARIISASEWEHILPDSIQISVTNRTNMGTSVHWIKTTGSGSVSLTNGVYQFTGQSPQSDLSDYLPIRVSGTFTVRGSDVQVDINPIVQHALVTIKNQLIDQVTINGQSMRISDGYFYKYIKSGLIGRLMIRETVYQSTIDQSVSAVASSHFNFVLELEEGESNAAINIVLQPFQYQHKVIIISRAKTAEIKAGEKVTIIATANEGFVFDHWEEDGSLISRADSFVYTMPAKDVSIKARFKKIYAQDQ